MISSDSLVGIKHISVDIFDTLLIRTCSESAVFESAYLSVADTIDCHLDAAEFAAYRLKTATLSRQTLNKDEVSLEEIYRFLPIKEPARVSLKLAELQQHQTSLDLNLSLLSQLKKLAVSGVDVVLISDMYLSAKQLYDLLFTFDPWLADLPLYVSAEFNQTKRLGDLFITVMNERGWQADRWLHVGDDRLADVSRPQELGIKAQHLDFYFNYEQLSHLEQQVDNKTSHIESPRKLASLASDNGYYKLGAMIFGPILSAFADWVISKTQGANASTIFCISREGICFADVIKQRLEQLNIYHIRVEVFYASRQSVLLPGINIENPNWLAQLLAELVDLGNISVAQLFQLFHLSLPEQFTLFADYLSHQWSETKVVDGDVQCQLFAYLQNHQQTLLQEIIARREAFQTYCQNLGSFEDYVTIDFGGGGTIQAKLAQLLPKPAKANLLFYQTSRVYRFAQHLLFTAFISNEKADKALVELLVQNYFLLETLFNGWQGSVVRYTPDGEAVLGQAILQNKLALRHFYAGLKAFNQGMINTERQVDVAQAKQILQRFIHQPLAAEAALFCDLYHQSIQGNEVALPVMQNLTSDRQPSIKTYYWAQGWQALYSQGSETLPEPHQQLLKKIAAKELSDVAIYGAGQFFETLLPLLLKQQINITCVIDRKAELLDYAVQGYPVISLEQAIRNGEKVFVIASASFVNDIRDKIIQAYQRLEGRQTLEIISV